MKSSRLVPQLLELLIGIGSFGAAMLMFPAHGPVTGEPAPVYLAVAAYGLAVVVFWIATEYQGLLAESRPAVVFLEHLGITTGTNMLLQALLGYVSGQSLIPLPAVLTGGVLASTAVAALRARVYPRLSSTGPGVLIVGADGACGDLVSALSHRLAGVVGPPQEDGGRRFGGYDRLFSVLDEVRPEEVVLAGRDWPRQLPAEELLRRKLNGVPMHDAEAVHESALHRVCYAHLDPAELLFAPALRSGRHVMAIQAIYTDLAGLVLVILLSPVLLVTAVLVALFCGSGPVIEKVECMGFQFVPFHLLRFRTRDLRTGRESAVGRMIRSLHLANLPQLINIFRGEVVFIGPRPVRRVFAERLMNETPYYAHLFSIKPGVVGWAQVNVPRNQLCPETLRLEYDFYYIKRGSVALDLEILARTVWSWFQPRRSGAAR